MQTRSLQSHRLSGFVGWSAGGSFVGSDSIMKWFSGHNPHYKNTKNSASMDDRQTKVTPNIYLSQRGLNPTNKGNVKYSHLFLNKPLFCRFSNRRCQNRVWAQPSEADSSGLVRTTCGTMTTVRSPAKAAWPGA